MRKMFFMCWLLALTLGAAAQGTAEIPVKTQNSIIRVYGDGQMVIYNRHASNIGQFMLAKHGQASVSVFNLPTADMDVLDFEIMGDTVWFCGVYKNAALLGGSAGVVGMFDIPGAFAGSEQVHYTVVNAWLPHPSLYDEAMYIRNLKRLDVFRDQEMGTVAAMIGDAYLFRSTWDQRVAAVSAYLLPSGANWQVVSSFPKDGRMVLTDVACLDDMIVTVGHGLSNTHCITKTYHRIADFPILPFDTYMFDSIYCVGANPRGTVLAAHVEDNIVALAQLDKKPGTLLHVLQFSITTGHPTIYTQSRKTDFAGCDVNNCPWKLEELRFSDKNRTLHILERGLLPGDTTIGSLLWKFPLMFNGELSADVQQMTDLTQSSMDVDIDNHPVLSGAVDASGLLDVQTFTPGGTFHALDGATQSGDEYDKCTYNTEVKIEDTSLAFPIMGADDPFRGNAFNDITFFPVVNIIESNKICE